jgi:hypothetical protein
VLIEDLSDPFVKNLAAQLKRRAYTPPLTSSLQQILLG